MQIPPLQTWSIVRATYPFEDVDDSKDRPCLVLQLLVEEVIVAKITGLQHKSLHPGQFALFSAERKGTGHTKPSIVNLRKRARLHVSACKPIGSLMGLLSDPAVRRRILAANEAARRRTSH